MNKFLLFLQFLVLCLVWAGVQPLKSAPTVLLLVPLWMVVIMWLYWQVFKFVTVVNLRTKLWNEQMKK